jgi:hypothetical protein
MCRYWKPDYMMANNQYTAAFKEINKKIMGKTFIEKKYW